MPGEDKLVDLAIKVLEKANARVLTVVSIAVFVLTSGLKWALPHLDGPKALKDYFQVPEHAGALDMTQFGAFCIAFVAGCVWLSDIAVARAKIGREKRDEAQKKADVAKSATDARRAEVERELIALSPGERATLQKFVEQRSRTIRLVATDTNVRALENRRLIKSVTIDLTRPRGGEQLFEIDAIAWDIVQAPPS